MGNGGDDCGWEREGMERYENRSKSTARTARGRAKEVGNKSHEVASLRGDLLSFLEFFGVINGNGTGEGEF